MSDLTISPPPAKAPQSYGRYRLVILGASAIMIAFITSGISLFIYTSSGDIYLDRSRPGFISDIEPPTNDGGTSQTTGFPPDGAITENVLNSYLQKLDVIIKDIIADPNAFSSNALSDEALNITGSADY